MTTKFLITNCLLISWCLLNSTLGNSLNDTSDLLSVVVIYRHGDRTPVDPYPLDPYKNSSFWPVGFGQLTNLGKQQHYELGKWLRQRYNGFLPERYDEKDIYIRSTDVDRTLMSAQANLAGLYPPSDAKDVWNIDMDWQPIPVHTQIEEDDIILAMKTNCPRYNYFMGVAMEDPFFKELSKRNQPLYQYLTRNTGRKVDNIEALEFIYNTLYIETLNNFTLPDWAKRVFPDVMRPLAALSFALPCYNEDLSRLKTGPLFYDIWSKLNLSARPKNFTVEYRPRSTAPYIESQSKANQSKKMWVYSAHDTTIANVLNALRMFEYHSPPYASTILFELRQSKEGKRFVNLYYKNTTVPRALTLPGCNFDCPFEQFERILAPLKVSVSDWYVECEQLSIISLLSFESIEGIVFFVLCVFVMMIVMMLIVCIFCAKPKCEQRTYLRLPDNDDSV